jgi:hypothetical protein
MVGLESPSALNQINNQDNDRNYEQEMDQTAANVADEAKKPEHDQDHNYSPEHGVFLSVELNFRRLIYPAVYLLAKLFQNIESKSFASLPQGFRAHDSRALMENAVLKKETRAWRRGGSCANAARINYRGEKNLYIML